MFSCQSSVGHNFCNWRYVNYLLTHLRPSPLVYNTARKDYCSRIEEGRTYIVFLCFTLLAKKLMIRINMKVEKFKWLVTWLCLSFQSGSSFFHTFLHINCSSDVSLCSKTDVLYEGNIDFFHNRVGISFWKVKTFDDGVNLFDESVSRSRIILMIIRFPVCYSPYITC
jgi:hypothetical protein